MSKSCEYCQSAAIREGNAIARAENAERKVEEQSKRLAEWEAIGIEKDAQIGYLQQLIAAAERKA